MTIRAWLFLFSICLSPCAWAQQRDSSDTTNPASKMQDEIFRHFRLDVTEKKIRINWSIDPDSTADYFAVERNSNGTTFETIAIIKGGAGFNQFEYIDELPFRGTSIYRIRLTNASGDSHYSPEQPLTLRGTSLINFYPNPADNVLIIRLQNAAEVVVADQSGKVRIKRTVLAGPSIIDVSNLEKGSYFLRVTDSSSGSQESEKFLKN